MLSDEAKGLNEAIDNAVEYFMEKGLRPSDVLTILSNNRMAWKDKFISDATQTAVDALLEDIFRERGTE